MKTIAEIELGKDGLVYVEKILKGWSMFAENIPSEYLRNGRVFAIVPQGTSLDRAKKLECGGIGMENSVVNWLSEHLLSNKCNDAALVIENTAARSEDKSVKCSSHLKFFYHKWIYNFCNTSNFSDASIKETFFAQRGFMDISFYISTSVDESRVLNKEVDEFTVKSFIEHIEEIFLGAYDGESLVV